MENMIPIYVAVFIPILLMMVQQNQARIYMMIKKKRKRGGKELDNILDKCVGKRCVISTGSMGIKAEGVVRQVGDKWVEIETKNATEILGIDFIQHVKIKKDR